MTVLSDGGIPTPEDALAARKEAYENRNPGTYFRVPKRTASRQWECWQQGEGDAEDKKIGQHPDLGDLLDSLEKRENELEDDEPATDATEEPEPLL